MLTPSAAASFSTVRVFGFLFPRSAWKTVSTATPARSANSRSDQPLDFLIFLSVSTPAPLHSQHKDATRWCSNRQGYIPEKTSKIWYNEKRGNHTPKREGNHDPQP